jgi:hypothetical protein
MRDTFEKMLEPTDKLTLTARIMTAVWLSILMVEFFVWLLISIIGGHVVSPWWLWTIAVGGTIVGGFWYFVRNDRKARS